MIELSGILSECKSFAPIAVLAAAALLHTVNLKKWLVIMCTYAESEYGAKTGALKEGAVYEKYVETCPIISKIVPYGLFKLVLKWALCEMRKMLSENEFIDKWIKEGDDDER